MGLHPDRFNDHCLALGSVFTSDLLGFHENLLKSLISSQNSSQTFNLHIIKFSNERITQISSLCILFNFRKCAAQLVIMDEIGPFCLQSELSLQYLTSDQPCILLEPLSNGAAI